MIGPVTKVTLERSSTEGGKNKNHSAPAEWFSKKPAKQTNCSRSCKCSGILGGKKWNLSTVCVQVEFLNGRGECGCVHDRDSSRLCHIKNVTTSTIFGPIYGRAACFWAGSSTCAFAPRASSLDRRPIETLQISVFAAARRTTARKAMSRCQRIKAIIRPSAENKTQPDRLSPLCSAPSPCGCSPTFSTCAR